MNCFILLIFLMYMWPLSRAGTRDPVCRGSAALPGKHGGEGEHVTAEADLGPKWAFEAIDARMMFGTSLMMALSRVQLVDIVERGLAACTRASCDGSCSRGLTV